jgi:hypothetical protein
MSSEGGLVDEVEDHNGYVTFRCTEPDRYSIEIYCSLIAQSAHYPERVQAIP